MLEATVTIKLTDKAKDTYVKFTGGTPEAAVHHVKLFYSLVEKMELVHLKDNRELLRELGPITDSSPLDEIQQKQDLEEENKANLKDMTTLENEYWMLFEQLLGLSLIPDWQNIVQVKTATKGYIGRDCIRVEGKVCGKRFSSMDWCVRSWLHKVVKPNAAERHCQYMLSQIVWPTTKVGIGAFVDRVIDCLLYTSPSPRDRG